MSLKAIKEVVADYESVLDHPNAPAELRERWEAAKQELAALETAATDLTRLHLIDGAEDVAHRGHVIQAMSDDPASQWNHPDVVAWGEAAQLLAEIAKGAK